jgi:PhnB protein
LTVRLNPYLRFRDNAREAMTFYNSVLGGELTVSRFADYHASADPTEQQKVMHSQLVTSDGLVLMGRDTPTGMEYRPQTGVSVSLSGDDEARLRGYWERLSEGGTVAMPSEKAPWGARSACASTGSAPAGWSTSPPSPPEPWAHQLARPLAAPGPPAAATPASCNERAFCRVRKCGRRQRGCGRPA